MEVELFSVKFQIKFRHQNFSQGTSLLNYGLGRMEVKCQNPNKRFERKINAGFVFSVRKFIEKYSSSNFLIRF